MAPEDVIASVVEDVAGQDVLPLLHVLKGKKNVSEFTIAEELKEEINTIRNKLYRLYDFNLVEFSRKKDQKKGWYIYYWTFVPSRIPRLLREIKKKKLVRLKEKLKSEQGSHFYECMNKCMRLTFDKAIDFEFKCPECGSLMNQEDNAKRVEHIISEIETLERDISVVEPEFIAEEEQDMMVEDEVKDIPNLKVKVVQKETKVKIKMPVKKTIKTKLPARKSKKR
ncbi:TPA: hypothetical protein HA219_04380 [Candidatus Woesearchaeota archaeon]|nr:hypothetical protein [Candidatus Woesearchaeota archaeon]HIH39927.1 hypothetical protein [Candidatus Woesearchaeota archaeon]